MKASLALCAVLRCAALASGAQDLKPEINLTATSLVSVSERDQQPTSTVSPTAAETGTACTTGSPASIKSPTAHPEFLPSALLLPPRATLDPPPGCSRGDSGEVPSGEAPESSERKKDFQWSPAIKESLLFLGVQHGYAVTQPKTRRDLRGSFFGDYGRSVKSLRGWGDGGRFFTNYVAHPMQGSFLGFIQIQNDPNGSNQRVGRSKAYWRSRLKALAWSAAWSTQFEIGPISQASIGNVGLHGKQTYIDLVITPVGGLGLLLVEDTLDQYLVRMIERKSGNIYLKIVTRVVLNPTRSVANMVRFKKPWHRDSGLR